MQARHLRKSPSSQLETGHAAAPLRPPATDAPAHRQRSTIAIRQAPHILHQWMKERLFLTDGNGNGRRPASNRFLRSEERRGGKESVSTGRTRGWQDDGRKNKKK